MSIVKSKVCSWCKTLISGAPAAPEETSHGCCLPCSQRVLAEDGKAKFTPGPWTVDECEDALGNLTIRRADGTPNGDTEHDIIATVYGDDARLIALAPELAAFAQHYHDFIENEGEDAVGMDLFIEARALLARVRGT